MSTQHRTPRFFVRAVACATALAALCASGPARADAPPPRPEAASAAVATSTLTMITLDTRALPRGARTVVQWGDPAGGWHDVEGWRQVVDAAPGVRWTVYQRDFATGPFRWAAYAQSGGALLGVTPSFQLPCCAGSVNQYVLPICTPSATAKGGC